ncbi:hypothetical protein ABK040_002896 [Willaertia magna]
MTFGFILTLFGILFVSLYSENNQNIPIEIINFNQNIRKWNNVNRYLFKTFNLNTTIYLIENYNNTILNKEIIVNNEPFIINEDSDKYHPDNLLQILKSQYQTLKFIYGNTNLIIQNQLPVNFNQYLKLIVNYDRMNQIPLNFTINQMIPLFLKIQSKYSDICNYGFIENGKCYHVHRLRDICFKVNINLDSSTNNSVLWKLNLDNTFGGCGCYPSPDDSSSIIQSYSGLTYIYTLLQPNESVYDHHVNFNDLTFTIRYKDDPWILANYITNGTLNFSYFLDLMNDSDFGFARALGGFGSITIGMILISPSTIAFVILCSKKQWRRRFLVDGLLREEHAMLLSGAVTDSLEDGNEENRKRRNLRDYLFPNSF